MFRSQTSNFRQYGQMKSRDGKSQRRAEKKNEEEKRKSQKKEDPGARKGRKVARHCVFPMICGFGGSKSRLAKATGAEPAGQMRDEKLHAVVARSAFRSQNVQSKPCWDHFWKLRCRKSARCCGAKHISKSKCTKHLSFGALVEVATSKTCTPLWREAHFEFKMYKTPQLRTTFGSWDVEKSARSCGAKHISESKVEKNWGVRSTFGRSDVVLRGRRTGLCTLSKVRKTCDGCVAFPKTMAGVGHLKRICQDEFSVAGAVQETCLSEMPWGPGADFLRGVAFWSIRSSVLGRWFCVTGAALRMNWHHFFVASAML